MLKKEKISLGANPWNFRHSIAFHPPAMLPQSCFQALCQYLQNIHLYLRLYLQFDFENSYMVNPPITQGALHTQNKFVLRISSVSVTKSAILRIWSQLMKKSLMENAIFYTVATKLN